MKTEFERIIPDPQNSFRVLHQKVSANTYPWHYHYHPELEMVCVLGGSGRRHVGNHLSYYEDGDLVFIGSDLPHGGFGYGAVDMHEEIVIQFREDFLGNALSSSIEFDEIKQFFERSRQGISFYGNTQTEVKTKLKKILQLSYFERLLSLLDILQQLATSKEFMLLNPAEVAYSFNKKDELRLKNIYEYVEKHHQRTISIEEIAAEANLSVPAFCNYFKRNMNQTFVDFLNEFRVNKACKMMLDRTSFTDICFSTGFSSLSYFSKVFKDVKGKSPREYKNSVSFN